MEAQHEVSMGAMALEYAAAGFKVFPLNGKVPRSQNGCKDATVDVDTINRWWRIFPTADIGIATGDGLLVVDFDLKGEEFTPEQQALIESMPATRCAVTQGGGLHYYLYSARATKNTASKLADNVDTRGDGGYVVAPPSCGGAYRWQSEADMVVAPGWLVDKIAGSGARQRSVEVMDGDVIPDGKKHAYCVRIAGAMRRQGGTADEIYAAFLALQDRFETRVPEDNLRKLADDAQFRWTPEPDELDPIADVAAANEVLAGLEEKINQDPGIAFRSDIVAAMSVIEREDKVSWERVRAVLRKKKVHLNAVTSVIKEHRRPKIKPSDLFEDAPIELTIPGDWRCRHEGVFEVSEDLERRILHAPLLMTKRLKDIDNDEERVELAWLKDGTWTSIAVPRSVIATSVKINELADSGLPVTSNTASQVVRYLSDVEAANLDKIPLELCVGRSGWVSGDRFVPGAADDVTFAPPGWSMRNMFGEVGDIDAWRVGVDYMRTVSPLMRVQLAASFAAPLLQPLGARNFILHLWGRSGSGKTAALRCAWSVWGSASGVITFNGTQLGLQNHAAMLNDLPVCINERQVGDKNMDRMLYALAEGTGRVQGARDGGNRAQREWRSIILTNGEEPLTGAASMQGTRTRSIEICGEPFDNEADARALYDLLGEHHGLAGPIFARRLMGMSTAEIRRRYDFHKDRLMGMNMEHIESHLTSLAVVCLADELANEWVFQYDVAASRQQACDMADLMVAKHLDRGEEVDQGEVVYDWIVAHVSTEIGLSIAARRGGFTERGEVGYLHPSQNDTRRLRTVPVGILQERYRDRPRLFIKSSHLRELLERAGFSHRGAVMHLGRAGLIETTEEAGKTRYARKVDGVRTNIIVMPKEFEQLGKAAQ